MISTVFLLLAAVCFLLLVLGVQVGGLALAPAGLLLWIVSLLLERTPAR